MNKILIGYFTFVDDTIKAIEELRKAGIENITVYSPIPSHDIEHVLNKKKTAALFPNALLAKIIKRDIHVARFTALGAFLGIVTAIILVVGTALLFPIQTGGMPIITLPPLTLVLYEFLILGSGILSILGFIFLSRLAPSKLKKYSPKSSEERFSIAYEDESENTLIRVKKIFQNCNCDEIDERELPPIAKVKLLDRLPKLQIIGATLTILAFVSVLGYGFWWLWIQSTGFIERNHPALKPQEWPGYADSEKNVVPVSDFEIKLVSRNEAKALKNPVRSTSASIETGKKLFHIYCAICHGKNGEGSGLMGAVPALAPLPAQSEANVKGYFEYFMKEPPEVNPDYVGNILAEGEIYYTITYGGLAIMPSFRDALSKEERWHLINFIKHGFTGK